MTACSFLEIEGNEAILVSIDRFPKFYDHLLELLFAAWLLIIRNLFDNSPILKGQMLILLTVCI